MQLVTVRLPNGEDVDPAEWTTSPLYSTVEFQIGVSLSSLFLYSYGVDSGEVPISPATLASRPATDFDTNMQGQGSILPENERILLYSIELELINLGAPDEATADTTATPPDCSLDQVLLVQRDTLAILHIGSRKKEFCRAPLGYFAGACGVARINQPNAQNEGAATGFKVAYNSGINPDDNRNFASPHDIAGGTAFDIELAFPLGGVNSNPAAAGDVIRCRSKMYGFRKRPVA
jgi:hypothetical protein